MRRNDAISIEEIAAFDRIVLSPGPGLPKDAGIMPALLREYSAQKPILGVCLGMQAMAESFGGSLYNLETVIHGRTSMCHVTTEKEPLFEGIASPFVIGHYHSWAVDEKTLPKEWLITSRNENNVVMSMRHATLPLHGVQFHPESVLTPDGLRMIENWVKSND